VNPERWRKIQEIFNQAVDLDATARDPFLTEACAGDASLRGEVEKLLESDDSSDTERFLTPMAGNVKSRLGGAADADPLLGSRVGHYEIRKKLGDGGMGNVYLAVRVSDYQQRVALKVLKRGMDTDEILRRFRNEIQVLAGLSKHPHIAALLDAGTTDSGLPYFVMEYVEGQRLDQFCDQRRLGIRDRIRLFRDVCASVQFAHQHMVIHRDLKMSNILVRSDGVVKLIDFGIAKLTTPELGFQTVAPTRTEYRFLTPEYASPEQLLGQPLTAVSDVYSLGVVLYELLTGRRPYSLTSRAASELTQVVCEKMPEKPSTAFTITASRERQRPESAATGDTVTAETISANRDSVPRKLRQTLAGDLDNIVLQALRKEPHRRYASVEQLSADLQCYLDNKPVEARPISRRERLWRWCRRNPLPTSLLVTVFLTLIVGLLLLSRLSERMVRSTALDSAALEADMLQETQDFYSRQVVEKVERAEVEDRLQVSHLYASKPNAIPVPASFTIDLGERIGVNRSSGMYARLYSDSPFKGRGDGGPHDDFEKEALEFLRRHPDEPFYRFEEFQGRQSLRYATARVMKESCVRCHNNHEASEKRDWKVGDVRGVLEIVRPLDKDIARTREGLRETFLFMILLSATLLGLSLAFLLMGKRR
jgi:serine/threonine protein kinase